MKYGGKDGGDVKKRKVSFLFLSPPPLKKFPGLEST